MKDFLNFIGSMLCVLFFVCASPFVVAHIVDNWDEPSYPHTGFTPEYPTWEAPEEEKVPTYNTRRN